MEKSWENCNWPLHMEMGGDDDFLEQCHTDDDEFLRDILQQPAFSSESESQSSFHDASSLTTVVGGNLSSEEIAGSLDRPTGKNHLVKNNSSNSIVSHQHASKRSRPSSSSSPRTYILSFDNSTVIPATPEAEPCLNYEQLGNSLRTPPSKPWSSKRTLGNHNSDEPRPSANQGPKKARNSSQTMDHIMAERKRRQELTERFIALSATIPGLKKTDKASILRAAIDYVKQLQERVMELEKQDKNKGAESIIFTKKSDLCANEDTTSSETSSDDCGSLNEALPQIEARVLEKEVLVEVHCEKENGIELKIVDQLENLHLCVTGSSVLPFGNSAFGITIIAQMGNAYKMTVNDLVKNLRQVLCKSHDLLQQ